MIYLAACLLLAGLSIGNPIVGGSKVFEGQFAFIAHITDSSNSCTGVILDQSTLLTAGHCGVSFSSFDSKGRNIPKRGITITANNVKANNQRSKSPHAVSFQVESIFLSPYYKEVPNFSNDISIWKVTVISGNVDMIPKVQLDNGYFSKVGTKLTVAGYGQTSGGKVTQGSLEMLTVSASVVDSVKCDKIYKKLSKSRSAAPGFDPSSQLCAGNLNGKQGACFGDSGGPLFYMNGRTPVIVALVSHGNGSQW